MTVDVEVDVVVDVEVGVEVDMDLDVDVTVTTCIMLDAVPVVTGAERVQGLSVHQKSVDPATMVAALV